MFRLLKASAGLLTFRLTHLTFHEPENLWPETLACGDEAQWRPSITAETSPQPRRRKSLTGIREFATKKKFPPENLSSRPKGRF
jgi:hypothetical protein